MNANTKFGVKEVMDVILYDMETGTPVIFFDTLKTSNLEMTSEKVYARGGKGNAKLLTWELNKEGKLTIEDALLSPKSLELLSGNAGEIGSKTIYQREVCPVDNSADNPTITLAYKPKETAENIIIYSADDDCGTPIKVTDVTDKTITIDKADAASVIVYYTFESTADTEQYIIDADKFSGTYKLVGNTVIRNSQTGTDEAFQIVIPNLKWSSNITLNFAAEGDPQPISFECEILKDPNSSTMVELTRWA